MMSDSRPTQALLREHIHDPSSQWNLGTFGAVAEFMRDPHELVAIVDEPERLSAVTARGGICFDRLDGIRLFASETASGKSWTHRVALCLPEEACVMNRRRVLTELGADAQALRAGDAGAVLFDIGLGTVQVDVCIRTDDPQLIATLRPLVGRSLFEPGNPGMPAIVAAGPHRVFIARFGRCEVYQPIPPADGKSPEGPHTHVLPQLLQSGRTHAATEPVPAGFVPCAHLVPAHPVKDAMGRPRAFDADALGRFEAILGDYGGPDLVAIKRDVRTAIAAGEDPDRFEAPQTRFGRHALRVALRQLAAQGVHAGQLQGWLTKFDGQSAESGQADEP